MSFMLVLSLDTVKKDLLKLKIKDYRSMFYKKILFCSNISRLAISEWKLFLHQFYFQLVSSLPVLMRLSDAIKIVVIFVSNFIASRT